ncbi:MAG TPA: hypothetical protein VGS96_09820 [Thermoanaerobaculia bacterium]|jgi:hypothetical protein|nr:hypothetical protein [Thermoanaerobaculia bacterium]
MEVDKDVLQVALARAITDSFTPEIKEKVIRQAIEHHLFEVDRRHNSGGESPISGAFKNALNDATREMARLVVNDPANTEKIKGAIQRALDEALADVSFIEKLKERLVSGMGRGY